VTKITDAFLGEHGVFYAQFDKLEEALPNENRIEVLRGSASLLAAGLEPHARLEDDLLFAAMENKTGAGLGLVSTMRVEHEEIEGALRSVAVGTDPARAREMLLEAIHLARAHFLKEEQVAFPMAEEVLGAEDLMRLGGEWARARGVVLTL
jgi:iron-sulfur cluster repair protein YtfE (RIC family)